MCVAVDVENEHALPRVPGVIRMPEVEEYTTSLNGLDRIEETNPTLRSQPPVLVRIKPELDG